jgi:hypothetical protein
MDLSPAIGFWVAAKVRRIGRNCNRNLLGLSDPDQRPARSGRALYAPVLAQLDQAELSASSWSKSTCCRSAIAGARDGCEFNTPGGQQRPEVCAGYLYGAKTQLSSPVARAGHGEEIVIAKADKPVARLVAVPVQEQPEPLWEWGKSLLGIPFVADDY